MDLEELKKEFRKQKASDMKSFVPGNETGGVEILIQKIRHQDKKDERYILHRKILPVSGALILLTVIFMITRITNPILLTGSVLVFFALALILVHFSLDYRNISRESFSVSMLEFLNQKQERLKSWRFTPTKYNIIFGVFVVGLLMMIVGNTNLTKILRTTGNILIYIGINLMILFISWLVGEYKYRKRYREKQLPLIREITILIDELKME